MSTEKQASRCTRWYFYPILAIAFVCQGAAALSDYSAAKTCRETGGRYIRNLSGGCSWVEAHCEAAK
jgi:hypothetical protein